VELAIKLASEHKGEIAILFSPGCSSFDEFSDYRRRGEEFKRLIQAAN
jgi:UDP-N-acetylmuramoylalanine-D-glutamate ligase